MKKEVVSSNAPKTKINKKLFCLSNKTFVHDELGKTKTYSYWKIIGKKIITNWAFVSCLIILLIFVICAFVFSFGKIAIPTATQRPSSSPALPGWYYLPDGTKHLYMFGLGLGGEDFFTEIMIGSKWTIYFVIIVVIVQTIIGLIIGFIWGYFKKLDILFINITNVINMVPTLILILVCIAIGTKNSSSNHFWIIILAISIQSWISFALATRIQTMIVKNREFNVMSKLLASKPHKIIVRNILPQIAPILVSTGAFAIPDAISLDTSLSYLNFSFVDGTKTTSLGFIIQQTITSNQWMSFPNLIIFPAIFVILFSFVFFLICKIIADAMDPKNN